MSLHRDHWQQILTKSASASQDELEVAAEDAIAQFNDPVQAAIDHVALHGCGGLLHGQSERHGAERDEAVRVRSERFVERAPRGFVRCASRAGVSTARSTPVAGAL
jgi:hypothetical protein